MLKSCKTLQKARYGESFQVFCSSSLHTYALGRACLCLVFWLRVLGSGSLQRSSTNGYWDEKEKLRDGRVEPSESNGYVEIGGQIEG